MNTQPQILARLDRYLNDTVGLSTHLATLPKNEVGALPFHLRDSYRLHAWTFHDRNLALAELRDGDNLTPGQIAKQIELLERTLNRRVVLLATELSASHRRRLIEHKVPFVVPGKQLYLPDLLIDLRENFPPSSAKRRRTTILPSAQLLLFFHLLRKSLDGKNLTELSDELGYTPMSVMRAVDSLEAVDLCATQQPGRDRKLAFQLPARELWQKSLPYLKTPVEREALVADIPNGAETLRAGISALSDLSMLADDRVPTYAVDRTQYRTWIREGRVREQPFVEHAIAKLQLWKYPPKTLTTTGMVDTLSLYVSCLPFADERSQMAVAQLKDRIESRWS